MFPTYSHTIRGVRLTFRAPNRLEVYRAREDSGPNPYDLTETLLPACCLSHVLTFTDAPSRVYRPQSPDTTATPQGFLSSGKEASREPRVVNLADHPYKPGEVLDILRGLLDFAGYGQNQEKQVEEATQYADSLDGRLDRMVLMAIGNLNTADLFQMDPWLLRRTYAQAERILSLNGIDTRIFLDPESYEKDMQKKMKRDEIEKKHAEALAQGQKLFGFETVRDKSGRVKKTSQSEGGQSFYSGDP